MTQAKTNENGAKKGIPEIPNGMIVFKDSGQHGL